MKKVICIALVLGLLTAMLGGCAGSMAPTPSQHSPSGSSGSSAPTSATPITISWLGSGVNPGIMPKDTEAQKLIEKQFNVIIEPVLFDGAWEEKLTALFAAGDIPDVIFIRNLNELNNYATQRVLAEIPIATLEEKYPSYITEVNKVDPKLLNVTQIQNKNWAIARYDPIATQKRMSAFRKSWLDNVGVTELPETIQEFEDVFLKFVNEDPDKNDKKDTYGFSIAWKGGSLNYGGSVNDVVTQFYYAVSGTMPNTRLLKDGKIVDGSVDDKMKDALKLLAKWYKLGIIDPEFVTTDTAAWQEKFLTGKYGFYGRTIYWVNPFGMTTLALQKSYPGEELVLVAPPKGDGGQGIVQDAPLSGMIGFGRQVGQDTDKMDKIFEILQYCDTNIDFAEQLSKDGAKDVHWKYDENGMVTPIAPYDNKENLTKEGRNDFFLPIRTCDFYFRNVLPANADKLTEQYAKGPYDPTMKYPVPSATQLQNNVFTVVDEWYAQFIMGQKDVDADWDKFVAEWKAAGGETLAEEADTLYQEVFK